MPIDISCIRTSPPPFRTKGARYNRVEVYLTDEEYEWLQRLARYLDRSMSATLRQALYARLKEHRQDLLTEKFDPEAE
jgi:hypothetical protein